MIETVTILDTIRFITGIVILFYASYTDIKTREKKIYITKSLPLKKTLRLSNNPGNLAYI